MASRLRAWWDQVPSSNPVQRRQAGYFQAVLAGWILLVTFGLPFSFLQGAGGDPNAQAPVGPMPPIFLVILGALSLAALMLWLSPVIALVLLRRGRFNGAVHMAVWGLLFGHSIATYALGVTDASVLVVYQIPVALAGLLGGRRLLRAVASYSIIYVSLVAFLQLQTPPMAGFFSPSAMVAATGGTPPPLNLGQPLGFFIGVTLLSSLLLDRFGGALRVALSEALERENELHAIRATLEATVSERTAELAAALQDAQRRSAEQERLIEEIEQQRGVIRDLNVPVIPISARTLVLPLVGSLDSARLQQLQEQSLQAIERTSARTLVLDVTGVPIVDSQVAKGLLDVVHACRLLGAQTILVGIRPEVAQAMVSVGIDMQAVRTFSDLQSALGQLAPADGATGRPGLGAPVLSQPGTK
jgi:rsbT co-antagonist protein RsbR